jgi:hypothetical protein
MKRLSACLLILGWLPPTAATDRLDPSGSYLTNGPDLALMVSGDTAVAVYSSDSEVPGHNCRCLYTFKKTADGAWRSTGQDHGILRIGQEGISIEDRELSCCDNGKPRVSALYSDSRPPESCELHATDNPRLKAGTTMPGVEVPEFAHVDDDDPGPGNRHLLRARIDGKDRLLTLSSDSVACRWGGPPAVHLTVPQAHTAALALYNAGKPRDAAHTLGVAIGSKPWTIRDEDVAAFNDWGFFLAEAKLYHDAVAVLSAVLAAFPDRTVAYLNVGDAYVGMHDTAKAKVAYRRYAEGMEKEGRKQKIPDRVSKVLQD